jgi:hypothetical protein
VGDDDDVTWREEGAVEEDYNVAKKFLCTTMTGCSSMAMTRPQCFGVNRASLL